MPISDSGLRRIVVHAGAAHMDLTMPSEVPVAALVTLVADLLPPQSGCDPPQPYRLCDPAGWVLDGSKTLAQEGIRDGSMLLLTRAQIPAPEVSFDDPAEQVAATVRDVAPPWSPATRRLTTTLLASGLMAVAGYSTVAGEFGAPKILLALAAAGTTALASLSTAGCRGTARATLCGLAGLAVVTAVAGIVAVATRVPLSVVGAAAVVVGVIGVRAAGRVAVAVTGLTGRPSAAVAQTDQALSLLTAMVAAASGAVALGGVGVVTDAPVAGVPRGVGVAFTAAAGVALALRARSHADGRQVAALLTGGAAAAGVALLSVSTFTGGLWPAAVATGLAGIVFGLGFMSPWPSPMARRAAEVSEGLALGSLVPLACWLCGGLHLAVPLGLG